MKKKIEVLIFFSILFFVCGAQALTYVYSGSLTINENQNDNDGIIAYNNGTIDMLGGSVWWININNQAAANIYGGTAGEFLAFNSSTFNIYGGRANTLMLTDTSRADISGGYILSLVAKGNSVANVYGGTLGLGATGNSIINIYGGLINAISASGNSIINLYAYKDSVQITTTGGSYNTGQVSGKYLDGSEFCINLGQTAESYLHIVIVPEPMTLLLLTLGSLVLRRK